MIVLLVVLEVAMRLSAFATLLAIPREPRTAAIIALASSAIALGRAFVRGEAQSIEMTRCWQRLIGGIRGRDVRDLSAMREDEEGVAMLSDAAREVAMARSIAIPDLTAEALTLPAVLAFAATRVPPMWMGLAACCAAPLAWLLRTSQHRQFAAQQRAYAAHGGLARDTRALVEASQELRAQGCEESFARGMLDLAHRMAREERNAIRLSALIGVVPVGLALIALVLPTAYAQTLIQRTGLLDLGIIGAATIATSLGVVRGVEAVRRTVPYREVFRRMAMKTFVQQNTRGSRARRPINEIRFEGISVVHPGADHATPLSLSATVETGGLALTGVNGSGKSTAISVLFGLVKPSRGRIVIDGTPFDEESSADLDEDCSYMPQSPFVSPGDTLAWHTRLVGVDVRDMAPWLEQIGLSESLRARALAHGVDVTDLKLGSLSGGEQQRFFLARTFGRASSVLVFDEPEAGLDREGRSKLGEMLEIAARDRLVLVVAHDVSFLPDTFRRVRCSAGQIEGAARGADRAPGSLEFREPGP